MKDRIVEETAASNSIQGKREKKSFLFWRFKNAGKTLHKKKRKFIANRNLEITNESTNTCAKKAIWLPHESTPNDFLLR